MGRGRGSADDVALCLTALSSSDLGGEESAGNSPQSTSLHGNPWMDMSAPVLLLNSDLRPEKEVAKVTEQRGELRRERCGRGVFSLFHMLLQKKKNRR